LPVRTGQGSTCLVPTITKARGKRVVFGSMIVWYGLRTVGIPEPYWAMISLIVVTEPDVTVPKKNVRARLINTANGAIVACLALFAFGASFLSMMTAMTVSVLIAMIWQNYPENWRLAPNTAVILMAATLNGNGLPEEVRLACSASWKFSPAAR
jgi:uncharacterized membrane protein YccC